MRVANGKIHETLQLILMAHLVRSLVLELLALQVLHRRQKLKVVIATFITVIRRNLYPSRIILLYHLYKYFGMPTTMEYLLYFQVLP